MRPRKQTPAKGCHRIELRGPWQIEQVAPDPASGRTTPERRDLCNVRRLALPADWPRLVKLAGGRIRLGRRFHRPTNLDASLRVFICLDGWPAGGLASLNGGPLGGLANSAEEKAFEVTGRLKESNVLEIEIELTAMAPGSPPPTAAIEIRQAQPPA